MRRAILSLPVFVALLALGCTTLRVARVKYAADGTEVDPPPGIRYSLPKPVLKVVPLADGTIDVEVVYLPDQEHTYAVHAGSRAARHKLEIAIDRGLLQRIAWDPEATAVATQSIERFTSVARTLLEERRRAEEAAKAWEAETEALAARKKLEQAADDALATLEVAELELALEREKLAFLLEQPPTAETHDSFASAQLAVSLAGARVDRARERVAQANAAWLEGLERRALGVTANASFSDATPGPVFYAINEQAGSPPTVKLTAAQIEPGVTQKSFKTVDLRRPARPIQPALSPRGGVRPRLPLASRVEYHGAAEGLRLAEVRLDTVESTRGSGSEMRKAEVSLALARERMAVQRERAHRFEVDSSLPLYRLGPDYIDDHPACEIIQPAGTTTVSCFLMNSAVVVVEVPTDAPSGSYLVRIYYVYRIGRRQGEGEAEIGFDVERVVR